MAVTAAPARGGLPGVVGAARGGDARLARRASQRRAPGGSAWLARLLELAPARFATAVLDDPGCNLSMWNLQRVAAGRRRGAPSMAAGRCASSTCRASTPTDRTALTRWPAGCGSAARRSCDELCEQYAERAARGRLADRDRRAEVGRILADGLVYDDALRGLHSLALALGEDFGDLFDEPDGARVRSFVAWLEQPAARGGAHGINRYVFHRVARERPDVMRAYPDLDGAQGRATSPGAGRSAARDRRSPIASCRRGRATPPGRPQPRRPALRLRRSQGRRGAGGVRGGSGVSAEPSRDEPGLVGIAVPRCGLTGYLGHTLGLGAAARGYAQALDAAGVPVRTVSVPLHHLALPVDLGSAIRPPRVRGSRARRTPRLRDRRRQRR